MLAIGYFPLLFSRAYLGAGGSTEEEIIYNLYSLYTLLYEEADGQ